MSRFTRNNASRGNIGSYKPLNFQGNPFNKTSIPALPTAAAPTTMPQSLHDVNNGGSSSVSNASIAHTQPEQSTASNSEFSKPDASSKQQSASRFVTPPIANSKANPNTLKTAMQAVNMTHAEAIKRAASTFNYNGKSATSLNATGGPKHSLTKKTSSAEPAAQHANKSQFQSMAKPARYQFKPLFNYPPKISLAPAVDSTITEAPVLESEQTPIAPSAKEDSPATSYQPQIPDEDLFDFSVSQVVMDAQNKKSSEAELESTMNSENAVHTEENLQPPVFEDLVLRAFKPAEYIQGYDDLADDASDADTYEVEAPEEGLKKSPLLDEHAAKSAPFEAPLIPALDENASAANASTQSMSVEDGDADDEDEEEETRNFKRAIALKLKKPDAPAESNKKKKKRSPKQTQVCIDISDSDSDQLDKKPAKKAKKANNDD